MAWYVYLVRCSDDSLYCGISTDPEAREEEHNTSSKAAKYTRSRRPVRLVWTQRTASRSEALAVEHRIKQLPKSAKEEIVSFGVSQRDVEDLRGPDA